MRGLSIFVITFLTMTGMAEACFNAAVAPVFFGSPPSPPGCDYDVQGNRNCESWAVQDYRYRVERYRDELQRYADDAQTYAAKVYDYAKCAADKAVDEFNTFAGG